MQCRLCYLQLHTRHLLNAFANFDARACCAQHIPLATDVSTDRCALHTVQDLVTSTSTAFAPPEPHASWPAQTLMSCQDRVSTYLLSRWVGVVALVGGWEGQVEGVEEMVALLLALRLTLSNCSRLQGNSACQSGSESVATTCTGTNEKVRLAVQAFAFIWQLQQSLPSG